MIAHDHKTIFVHIPKAAGQSIESFFLKLYGLDWETREPLLLRYNDNKDVGPPRLAHLRAKEYYQYHYISRELFEHYFKFTFVRNPWSRIVSIYKHFNYNRIIDFKNFIKIELPRLIREKYWFAGPQYKYIYDNDDLLVDYIGKFKNLNTDFKYICKKIGVQHSKLPHKNKSGHKKGIKYLKHDVKKLIKRPDLILKYSKDTIKSKNYRDYYDSELIDIISDLYHEDIERFNYTFN